MKAQHLITVFLSLAAGLLAGCENDAASFQIEDKDHALTLIREQRLFWSKKTDLSLVVARLPDCQRRHSLEPAPLSRAQASVYALGPRHYLLQQGGNWYDIRTDRCTLEALEQAPDIKTEALGTFDKQDGRLRFIAHEPG